MNSYNIDELKAEFERYRTEARHWSKKMISNFSNKGSYTDSTIFTVRYNMANKGAQAIRQFIWDKFGEDVFPTAASELAERSEHATS
jgi:hypothetical protein